MGDQQQKQGGQGQGGQHQRDQQAQQGGASFEKGRMGNKPSQSADQGMVGQDTGDDGKTVQPGQRPSQSHGTGQIRK